MIAAMSAAKLRKLQRQVHLLAAGILLFFMYLPLNREQRDVVRLAVLPTLALTGPIRRIVRRREGLPEGSTTPDHKRNGQMKLRELDERVTYAQQL